MIDRLLQHIAPHYCYSCGVIGTVFCENCKYDIIDEPYELCLCCELPATKGAKCSQCTTAYSRAWCVGRRDEGLRALIDAYKFERVHEARFPLAVLLDSIMPHCPNVTVVPIPTVPAHIRQRGYDHADGIARLFAQRRGLSFQSCLVRQGMNQQRGASRQMRQRQARAAFIARDVIKGATYLIIDDIVTTGATVQYAAQALRDAGAGDVWVAVVAHQTSTAEN